MAGYIGSKSSVTLVDGYTEAEADAEFVNDPSSVITVSGSNVGIGNTVQSSMVGTASMTIGTGVSGQAAVHTIYTNPNTYGALYFADATSGAARYQGGLEYQHPDDSLRFVTAATERMRIDSSGNVGIGTDSPDTKIQIKGAVNSSQLILGGTDGRGLKISTTNEGGQNDGSVIFDAQDTEGSGVNSNLIFKNGGTESFRISGNRTKDFGSFEGFSGGYNSKFKAGSAASYAVRMDAPGTGSAGILQVVNGYGQVGSIRVNGASTYFFTSSDYRLKTDVQPMTGASARVQALNPVNFEWIADGNRTDGFLAHEAQAVVPESVVGVKDAMKDEPYEVTPAVEATYDEEGNELTASVEAVMGTRSIPDHQSIDQSKLVPLLTAALQEALTEIASLKTRVEALEA